MTTRHTDVELAEQLRLLVDEDDPEAAQIVLVVDTLKTHVPACLSERSTPAEARRIARTLEWHYTPEHGSWLHIAECERSVLARRLMERLELHYTPKHGRWLHMAKIELSILATQ